MLPAFKTERCLWQWVWYAVAQAGALFGAVGQSGGVVVTALVAAGTAVGAGEQFFEFFGFPFHYLRNGKGFAS